MKIIKSPFELILLIVVLFMLYLLVGPQCFRSRPEAEKETIRILVEIANAQCKAEKVGKKVPAPSLRELKEWTREFKMWEDIPEEVVSKNEYKGYRYIYKVEQNGTWWCEARPIDISRYHVWRAENGIVKRMDK